MELLRKYSAMFIPVGIVLVAVVLIVATILMGGSLKKQMATSVTQNRTLQQLLNSAVPAKQWEAEKAYQDAHEKDAEAIAAIGSQTSQRPLLMYTVFPEPDPNETSNTIFHNFAKAYKQGIDSLLSRMKADRPYTAMEITTSTKAAAGSTGPEVLRLTDVLCKQRAQSMQVYADPYAFVGYDYGTGLSLTNRDRAVMECWYWQVAYWIQEDIADTIIAANSGSKNVLSAPVKRLLGISFAVPDSTSLTRMAKVASPGGEMSFVPAATSMTTEIVVDPEWPKYVTTASDTFVSPTPTGRITDDRIDVVHFSFAVVLRASHLLPFMEELCTAKQHVFTGFDGKSPPQESMHNQISILGCLALPVELAMDEALYYRYGDDALYKVNFTCEYIFDRGGYDAIKPEIVKNPPTAAGTGMYMEE